MIGKIKKFNRRVLRYIKTLFSKDIKSNKKAYVNKVIVSVVFYFASLIMLIINLAMKQNLMSICSVILAFGFFISFIIAFFFKKDKLSGIIISILVAFIISIFAISGGNQGFAILWVLLVPIISIHLLGIIPGFIVSTYFLVFLFVLFYSPLKSVVIDKYTIEFISRFPVLYLADYIISLFLSFEKEYYYKVTNIKSYVDELTNTYNRRYFMEKIKEKNKEEVTGIMIVDVNGLKTINDTRGHASGDELIKAVPICFRRVFGSEAEICRIGGDEYAVILHMSLEEALPKIRDAKSVASNYKNELIDGVSFSVGYATNEMYDTNDLDELFKKADELMYKDKNLYYLETGKKRRKN